MFSEIVHPLAFSALVVASYVDLKTREVPDWISYGLMFAGIGTRIIYSVAEHTWNHFFEGMLGMAAMFLVACALYYTGQWGGGDAKLLTGLGALFGMGWSTVMQFSVFYLLLLFVAGAFYGAVWSAYLFFANRNKCQSYLAEMHKKGAGTRWLIIIGACMTAISSLLVYNPYLSALLITLALAMVILYYTWLLLHALEKTCMQRYVLPSELTEGDWIVEDMYIEGKRVCGPADLGVSKEQIAKLKRYYIEKKIEKILIKEGIPFVPSFLIAYVILILFW